MIRIRTGALVIQPDAPLRGANVETKHADTRIVGPDISDGNAFF